MNKLILIGGTAIRINGKNIFVKNTFSNYLNELASNFDKVYWIVSSSSTVNCKTQVDIKNLVIISYNSNFFSIILINIKLFYILLREFKANVLMFPSPILLFVIPLIKRMSKKFIAYIGVDYQQVIDSNKLRNIYIWKLIFKYGHQLALSQSDLVIARGEYLKNFSYNFNNNVVVTQPLSWMNVNSVTRKESLDSIDILYIGKIIPEKGVFALVDAYSKILLTHKDLAINLHLVGDGQALEELKKYVGTAGLERVLFYGWIDSLDTIESLFEISAVLVCPTLAGYPEGVPRVIDEAIQFNVPVVASRIGGIPNEYTDGSVHLYDSSVDGSLYSALDESLFNNNSRNRVFKNMKYRAGRTSKKTAACQHASLFK